MVWAILLIIVMVIAAWLDTTLGKIAIASGVIAIGLLLLSWITGAQFFITLAKACAVIIVVIVVGAIILAIIGK